MLPPATFDELMDRVAANDEAAMTEFVNKYHAEIRTMVRGWLRPWETKLRRLFDSEDICQSVLAWFFLKDATGRYDLNSPGQLRNLFMVMVRNRVHHRVRQAKSEQETVSLTMDTMGDVIHPADEMAEQELRELIETRLDPEEAEIARHRFDGLTWEEVAAKMGGTAEARRKQFSRASNRILAMQS